MAALQEFKCPRCGGALNFDPNSQQVRCPYCGTSFEVESLQAYNDGLESGAAEDGSLCEFTSSSDWTEGEVEDMYVYVCQSCGGEIVGDQTLAATKCPYCDNPVVFKEKFAGDLKPDYVIPFKLDKEAAKAGLKNHMRGKKLVPAAFRDQNHIDEIKGVYVPVWLYDTDAAANMTFRGERIRTWRTGDIEYTETSYYALVRGGTVTFDNLPVDGSAKMDDAMMESLEPFDFSEAVDFQTAYLAGYLADRYDADAQEQLKRANQRIKTSLESALASTIGPYTGVIPENSSMQLFNTRAKYALYPVWLLSTNWNGKNYLFAMNGQTGKFVGDLPMDRGLRWKYFFRIAAAVTGGLLLISILSMFL